MSEIQQNPHCNRRKFIRQSVCGAGVLAAVAGVAVVSQRWRQGAKRAAGRESSNPFAYDVTRLTKTDPALIHYEEVGRIARLAEEPRRVVLGADDRLLMAAGNYVHVLDRSGARESDLAFRAPPRCLAVSGDGMIYVGLRDHVEIFDGHGQRRAAWDSPGPRTWFTGLAVGANDVFAADAVHRVVLRYDRSGKLLGRIGEKNQDRDVPGFVIPSPFFDVELHRDGLLRVTNPGRHRIEAYTFDGDLEMAWGKASASIEGFCGCCNPVNFALLADGRFVTCEKGLPRVKVYGADGTFQSVVAGPESFAENAKATSGDGLSDSTQGGLDVAVDARGRIYILDLVAGDVRIMARKSGVAVAETKAAL